MSYPRNKRFLVLLWTLEMIATSGNCAIADDVLRVFLFAGQSNMVGADAHTNQIATLPEFRDAATSQDDVMFWYVIGNGELASNGWESLRPFDSFGPEITFARRVKSQIDSPIAIIKSAVGGTTVAYDWNPDAPDRGQKLYPRTLQLVQQSLQALDQQGIQYRLEGVMWHQGENDMLDPGLRENYADGLKKLITRLREDLNAPQLKWYIAEVSEKGIWGMDHRAPLGILFQQQQVVLQSDAFTRWVPTSHLAFEFMNSGQPHYHFGTEGQLQMGVAMADAYLKEIDRLPAPTSRQFADGLPFPPKATVRLFVLAGQRSMEGEQTRVAQISDSHQFASLLNDQRNVPFRYSLGGGIRTSADWEPLGNIGFLGNFGPELSFGAKLRKSVSQDEGIAIVKFTDSGAQGPDWFPNGSGESHRDLYVPFISFIQEAKDNLAQQGYDCQLEGIFWHTGENDTYYGPYGENHAKWLKQLIDQSRADLNEPQLKWYVNAQFNEPKWQNLNRVNTALSNMAENDANVTIIQTSELPHRDFHLGTVATLLLGDMMAESYLNSRE